MGRTCAHTNEQQQWQQCWKRLDNHRKFAIEPITLERVATYMGFEKSYIKTAMREGTVGNKKLIERVCNRFGFNYISIIGNLK